MGFGNGIGIGWPMASSGSTPVVMGYFSIDNYCDGRPVEEGITSQLIDTSLYNVGDYVENIEEDGTRTGVLLGEIVFNTGGIIQISGPAYVGCPVYYNILSDCNGTSYAKGMRSNAFESGTYTGSLTAYVYSPAVETKVLLGAENFVCNIIPMIIEGPAYTSCSE